MHSRLAPGLRAAVAALCLVAGCSMQPSVGSAFALQKAYSVKLPPMPPAQSESPQAMYFLPSGIGAVSLARCLGQACSGYLMRTGDFGATWRTVPTGAPPFIGIRLFSRAQAVAWTETAVYTTDDGGSTWSRIYGAQQGYTVSAAFAGPQEGYVAVRGPCATEACEFDLFRTTDGGARWTKVAHDDVVPGTEKTPANLPSATLTLAADTSNGTVIVTSASPFFQVLVSTDGGRSFKTTLTGLGQGVGGLSIAMAPGGQGWAIKSPTCASQGCLPRLYHSVDAGGTWTYVRELKSDTGTVPYAAADGALWASVELPNTGDCDPCAADIGPFITSAGSLKLHALPGSEPPLLLDPVSARSVIALGYTQDGYALWTTDQGGQAWKRVASFFTKPFPQQFGMWNSSSGWAMGPGQGGMALLRTGDGAKTWQTLAQVPGRYADAAGMLNPEVAWVQGPGGWLITKDAGRIWTKVQLPKGFARAVGLETAQRGFAVLSPTKGAPANLYITEDGGLRWSLAKSDVQMAALGPARTVYAVAVSPSGQDRLLSSLDLGSTWDARRLPPAVQATGIGVAPDGTLWLFGGLNESTIWISADAGRRFETVRFPGVQVFPPPAVVSLDTWYILTGRGIYRTTDGGHALAAVAAAPLAPVPGGAP